MNTQNNVIEVKPIDVEVANKAMVEVEQLSAEIVDVEIKSQVEYDNYADQLKSVKAKWKELDSKRKEITQPLDKVKKVVMDLFRKPLTILAEIEKEIKEGMIVYQNEQDKIQAKAEVEFQRQLKEDEAKKKLLEVKADRAEEGGDIFEKEALKEKIEAIDEKPLTAVAEVSKPQGIRFNERWFATIVDANKIPRGFLIPDLIGLNLIARKEKGKYKVPGVKFVCEKIVVSSV